MTLPAADPRDAAAGEEPVPAGMFVLHGRSLRHGVTLETTSRYGDDVWRLDPAVHQQHQRQVTVRFGDLPAVYQGAARQLCYAMLSGPLPRGEQRPQIGTVRCMFSEIKRFCDWLAARPGSPPLAEVTAADLEDYHLHLLTVLGRATATTRSRARSGVRLFWRYRHALNDRLSFDPRRLDCWAEPRRGVTGENRTDRLPEAVCGPLLAWALRFTDEFSADILAANAVWRHMHAPRVRRSPTEREHALRALLDQHVAASRPLPGYFGKPALVVLAAMINDSQRFLLRYLDQVDAVAAVVGVRHYNSFDTPITARLDGQPWIDAVATTHRGNNHGLACLARMLQAACYILIAYLSGMRDSEIKHLRRGAVSTERDPDGRAYRWTVTSLAFKGETDPAGTTATWTVGAPAARAIAILEQLHRPEVDLLFTPLPHGPGAGQVSRSVNTAAVTSTTNNQLREFIGWVNDYCAQRGRTDNIPAVNGQAWRIKTSQFRRTLAWFIARRPGGTIAGAIAYRHLSVQMFEGYAGTSDCGFRAEVESEQALARGEHLLAMTDAHPHDTLAGPAAAEAATRLAAFAGKAGYHGTIITDPRRLKRLMDRADPAIYPGEYVTCVYTHATALCQRTATSERPALRACQPLDCRNVALTPTNTAAWQAELARLDARLATRPPLPPLLHQQLSDRRAETARFLHRHQETS